MDPLLHGEIETPEYDLFKSDIYSLGLTLIELASGI